VCAVLSPDGVKTSLLDGLAPSEDRRGRRALGQAIARCTSRSLLSPVAYTDDQSNQAEGADATEVLQMHRLVARALRDHASVIDQLPDIVSAALDLLEPHLFDTEW
jgi:hypothetical protein